MPDKISLKEEEAKQFCVILENPPKANNELRALFRQKRELK